MELQLETREVFKRLGYSGRAAELPPGPLGRSGLLPRRVCRRGPNSPPGAPQRAEPAARSRFAQARGGTGAAPGAPKAELARDARQHRGRRSCGGGGGGSGASAGTDPGRGSKEAAASPGGRAAEPPSSPARGARPDRETRRGRRQYSTRRAAAAAGLPGRGVVKLSPRAGEPRGAGEARLRGQGRHDGRGFPALSSGEGRRRGLGCPEDGAPPRQVTQRVPHLGPAAKRPRCRRARFTRSGEAGSVRRPSPPQPQGPRPSVLLLLLLLLLSSPPPPPLPGRAALDPPLRLSVRGSRCASPRPPHRRGGP